MEGATGGYYKQPEESSTVPQQQVNVPLMNQQQIQVRQQQVNVPLMNQQQPMQQQIQLQTVHQPMVQQQQPQVVVTTVVNENYYHEDLMVQAILVCCCCCHCLGIIAIFYAYEANNFHRFGKNEEAKNFNIQARRWIKYSLVCGLLCIGVPLLIILLSAA